MIKNKRNISRFIAVQILYQYDFFKRKKNLENIINDMIEMNNDEKYTKTIYQNDEIPFNYHLNKKDIEFINFLVKNVIEHSDEIDNQIKRFLTKNNSFDSLDEIVKQIIRLAIAEFRFQKPQKNVTKNIIINEYTNIAVEFYNKKPVNFVNAILDSIISDALMSC